MVPPRVGLVSEEKLEERCYSVTYLGYSKHFAIGFSNELGEGQYQFRDYKRNTTQLCLYLTLRFGEVCWRNAGASKERTTKEAPQVCDLRLGISLRDRSESGAIQVSRIGASEDMVMVIGSSAAQR